MSKPFALVIEDEPDLARLFATFIRSVGFKTEHILDGQTALERVTNTTPNVVVLDLHLPQISGLDILQQIRSDKRLTQTKIVIVTADDLLADKLSNDVDFILIKPINVRQLRNLALELYYMISDSKVSESDY